MAGTVLELEAGTADRVVEGAGAAVVLTAREVVPVAEEEAGARIEDEVGRTEDEAAARELEEGAAAFPALCVSRSRRRQGHNCRSSPGKVRLNGLLEQIVVLAVLRSDAELVIGIEGSGLGRQHEYLLGIAIPGHDSPTKRQTR